MYNPTHEYKQEDYIETNTGNIISRSALLCKPKLIEIPNGRCIIESNVIIRGDFAPIQINKYCFVGQNTVIRPGYKIMSKSFRFIPITIGSHSYIGEDCVIEASIIGIGCYIEKGSILLKGSMLKDYVYVLEGAVVMEDMVIPPFAIVGGNPAVIVGERPESASMIVQNEAVARHKSYKKI